MTTSKTQQHLSRIQQAKENGQKLVCLTAYSASVGNIISPYCDLILVGDSVGTVIYGFKTTQDVTLDMMINHGRAVRRGAPDSFIIVDMPYGTYETSPDQAVKTAQTIINETECDAVKLEGGVSMANTIKAITDAGIPVMAHIGLLPQSVDENGKYRITGKTDDEADLLLKDALAVQEAGAFSVVMEGIIEPVAKSITQQIAIPSIGIGASAACDGQVLVINDMLGLNGENVPKFVKRYAALDEMIDKAAKTYADEVRSGVFPNDAYTY